MSLIDEEQYKALLELGLNKLSEGSNLEELEEELCKASNDVLLRTVVIKEARKLHQAKMQRLALWNFSIGACSLAAGCFFALFNISQNQSLGFALFGLTCTGLIFIFLGLYRLFG